MLSEQRRHLLSLLIWRGLASSLLLLLMLWFYWPAVDALEQQHLTRLAFIWATFLGIQGLCWRYIQNYFLPQLFFQFLSDVLLIAALMFVTGGIHSPFVLLFGLVIVSAGTQARVLLVLSIAILASVAYLSSIYLFSWLKSDTLSASATLHLLLQISMFWLVGGVMALIARRHAILMLESDHILQEHRDFKHLHSDLMASMQEGILVLDVNLKVIDCNASFLHVLKHPAYLNKDLSRLGDFPEALMQSLLSDKQQSMRMEWRYGDATYLLTTGFFSSTQREAYAWLTLVDITQLRVLELKLAEQ
ncbi:MAG: hypothetical protein Q9M10_07395, partial [Mariprofundaceae bacterium]|nr:hypothetical protein [Mariprofundaceae bacterium]